MCIIRRRSNYQEGRESGHNLSAEAADEYEGLSETIRIRFTLGYANSPLALAIVSSKVRKIATVMNKVD